MAEPGLILTLAVLAMGLGLAGWLSHRLRLPPALGYLAVGAIASPAVASTPSLDPIQLQPAAHVAVLVLLFFIGLELDLKRLREVLRKGALTLPLDVLLPALMVTGILRLVGWNLLPAVALGLALGLSSTVFGERLASARNFPLAARQRTLGVLLAEDVAAVAILAVLAILGDPASQLSGSDLLSPLYAVGRLVFLFVLLTTAALLLVPRILDAVSRTHSHELMVLVGSALVLVFGWLGAWAGSAELGALMAGVAAAEAGSRFVVRNGLSAIRDIALALFFMVAGLGVDINQMLGSPLLILGLAAVVLVGKLAVHVPAGLASGLNLEGSLRSGLALGTVGEFSLILAAEAARSERLAHPAMGSVVVGVMVVLLVATPLAQGGVPRFVRLFERLPSRLSRPLQLMVKGVRSSSGGQSTSHTLRPAVRALVANLMLLLAWLLIAVTTGPMLAQLFPPAMQDFAAPVTVFGLATAVAAPLFVFTYRRYRTVVMLLVTGPGQTLGASKVRARLVDAWVAVTATILLVPVALLVPRTLPVLLGGVLVAIIVGTIAWRQLANFHQALEGTVERVLGQDPEADAIFDRVMEDYPWGVRFAAVGVPGDSPVANRTIRESRITELTGATVAVLQRNRREVVNPGSELLLHGGDTVVLMGDALQLARAEALVVAHGEALRMTAQSRLARIAETTIREGSELVGARLDASDVRGRTGTLIVGLWPKDADHPLPYRDDLVPNAGDRLIVLGAPLQVDRVRLLAEGQEYADTVESSDGDGPAPSQP